MTIIYIIILIAFILTVIVLINSFHVRYKEQYILTRASEKIVDGYLIFTDNGKITNFNKAILNYFEFDKKEVKDKYIFDLFNIDRFDKDDIQKIINSYKQVKSSREIITFDIKNKKNNNIYKVEIKSIVNNDIFLRYVMIFKNVTNAYEAIKELQNNQDLMANREKFATLGQLISRNCSFFKITYFCNIWTIRGIE